MGRVNRAAQGPKDGLLNGITFRQRGRRKEDKVGWQPSQAKDLSSRKLLDIETNHTKASRPPAVTVPWH